MACFKKSAKRRKMTNFSAIWKTKTRGENGRRKFKSFPVFPSNMSVFSLALWMGIAQLASPMWCQQFLCSYHSILVLQAPHLGPPGRTGTLCHDEATSTPSLGLAHLGVPTSACSKWSKLVSMARIVLVFYHPLCRSWTFNTLFSGLQLQSWAGWSSYPFPPSPVFAGV